MAPRAGDTAPVTQLKRSHFKTLLAIASLLGLAGVLVLFLLGGRLVLPSRFAVGSGPTDIAFESVRIESTDDITLSGWLLPVPEAEAGIMLMHGSGQNRAIMLPRARFLHAAGYSVLLFDFRAHGESEGRYRTFGIGEREDAEAALRFFVDQTGIQRVGIIGFSLGGAASILGQQPLPVDAYVLEAVFPTIQRAVANRIRLRLGSWLEPLHPLLTYQLPFRTGVAVRDLRPIEKIGAITAPVLMMAGEKDERTTLAESKALFEAVNAPNKAFWIVPGATHTNFHAAAPETYEEKVLDFFQRNLPPSTATEQ